MKNNKKTTHLHLFAQEEAETHSNNKGLHHLNIPCREHQKPAQEKSVDIFLINNAYDTFFTKILHKS